MKWELRSTNNQNTHHKDKVVITSIMCLKMYNGSETFNKSLILIFEKLKY